MIGALTPQSAPDARRKRIPAGYITPLRRLFRCDFAAIMITKNAWIDDNIVLSSIQAFFCRFFRSEMIIKVRILICVKFRKSKFWHDFYFGSVLTKLP